MNETNKCWPNHLHCGHTDYVGCEVHLYGHSARIMVDAEGYPSVDALDPDLGLSVEFSWVNIFNVVDNRGGRF